MLIIFVNVLSVNINTVLMKGDKTMLNVEFDGEILAVNQRSYNDKVYYVAQLFVNDSPDSISIDSEFKDIPRGNYHIFAEFNSFRKFMKIVKVIPNE